MSTHDWNGVVLTYQFLPKMHVILELCSHPLPFNLVDAVKNHPKGMSRPLFGMYIIGLRFEL